MTIFEVFTKLEKCKSCDGTEILHRIECPEIPEIWIDESDAYQEAFIPLRDEE